ncbi:MAG: dienelactone hydrolase family protein [Anaerolineae bacterium]|nr:dienelactone hydrolase family protein [Anaerolineae bacterium]
MGASAADNGPHGTDQDAGGSAVAELNGVLHRIRVPKTPGPHPTLIMLHGWEGDEDSTWLFARTLGPEWLVASPRAPFRLLSGYGWYQFSHTGRTDPETFQVGLGVLSDFISALEEQHPVDRARLVLLGFSQGGAMAYAYGLTHVVGGVVSLGGYIPGTVPKPLPPLNGMPVLIIHGSADDTIAVEIARKNRDQLTQAGAEVTYLEEEGMNHRVGVEGMRLLGTWLADRAR